MREHEVVADAQRLLFELGSEQVEAINAVSGDRCNPHPHVFSDRLLRPGDQAFFDIIHSFMGYRTCYYRTFNVGGASQSQLDAYKQCREWLDAAIELVRPGVTTDQIAAVWPTAEELGFPNEEACFGLQFGHGLGVGLYEAPMISRLHSLDHPIEIEEGMVFALETYCAASDGRSARAHRGGGRRHRRRGRDHHQVPGRGAAGARQDRTCAAPTSLRRSEARPSACMTDADDRRRAHTPARPRRRALPRALPPDAPHPPLRGRRSSRSSRRARCTARRTSTRARRRSRVGVGGVLGADDRVAGTYRGHGHALALGVEPAGRCWTSCSGARPASAAGAPGSMNVIDLEHRLIGCFGIVGGSIAAATGAALALKRTRRRRGRLLRRRARPTRATSTSA